MKTIDTTLTAFLLVSTGAFSLLWAVTTLRPLLAVTFLVTAGMAHPRTYAKAKTLLKVPTTHAHTFSALYVLLILVVLARGAHLSNMTHEPIAVASPFHISIDLANPTR